MGKLIFFFGAIGLIIYGLFWLQPITQWRAQHQLGGAGQATLTCDGGGCVQTCTYYGVYLKKVDLMVLSIRTKCL